MKVQFSIAAIMTALLVAFFGAVIVVGAASIKATGDDDSGPVITCTPTPVPTTGGVTPRPTRTPKASLAPLGVIGQGVCFVFTPSPTASPTASPSITPQPTTSPAPGSGITPRPTRTPKPSGLG